MRPTLRLITLPGATLLIGVVAGATLAATRPAPRPVASFDPSATPLRQVAAVGGPETGCATPVTAGRDVEQVRSALERWLDENPARVEGGTIRVAFHVITARGEGDVSDERIAQLIRLLNRGFGATGFRFELASVDRTENPAWFALQPGSRAEKQAKQALAVDPAHRLNLYSCAPGQETSGWASMPWSAPESDAMHGVVLNHARVSGATFDLGRAATHLIGHYLGIPRVEAGHEEAGSHGSTDDPQRVRAVVSLYRPSLFMSPAERTGSPTEIVAGAGVEPEDGRVLSYRGAFPNPFRAETALRFTLPVRAEVSLRIYSVTGQLVRTLVDATLPPGDHSAMLRAGDLPSGAYFSVLTAGRVRMSRTLLLVR